MKRSFSVVVVLGFIPFGIAAAIAQQLGNSWPGRPGPSSPESSPVRIKQGSTPRSGQHPLCIVHVTVIDTASGQRGSRHGRVIGKLIQSPDRCWEQKGADGQLHGQGPEPESI